MVHGFVVATVDAVDHFISLFIVNIYKYCCLLSRHVGRRQVVKNLWVYIKAHDLQNPADRRQILLNPEMKAIFKVDKCTIFSINSLLSKQLYPIE
jgi:hypothetical protein